MNERREIKKALPPEGLYKTGMTGLEPAAPDVTGQYSNQLSYIP